MSANAATIRNERLAPAHAAAPGWRALALASLLGLFLGGCKGGAAVTVAIDVPRPLVEPLDVAMGVYFDDTLRSYIHREELEDHGDYSIDIGASQAPVFAQVFDAMFDSVIEVAAEQPQANAEGDAAQSAAGAPTAPTFLGIVPGSVDGILAPRIEEVQFAIPEQTGGEFFEVWIRYRIRIYDASGKALAEWPLVGYGKANQRNYGGIDRGAGLNEATIWALRDAAALLASKFHEQAEVQDWLAGVKAGP